MARLKSIWREFVRSNRTRFRRGVERVGEKPEGVDREAMNVELDLVVSQKSEHGKVARGP